MQKGFNMTDSIKNEVLLYLNRHLYGNLATVYSNDPMQPHVTTVAYVNDGFDLYLTTSVKSITRKASAIVII